MKPKDDLVNALASFDVPAVDYSVDDHPTQLEAEQAAFARREFSRAFDRAKERRPGVCFRVQILFKGSKPQKHKRVR